MSDRAINQAHGTPHICLHLAEPPLIAFVCHPGNHLDLPENGNVGVYYKCHSAKQYKTMVMDQNKNDKRKVAQNL